jgi:ribosome biogenesis GTPase A
VNALTGKGLNAIKPTLNELLKDKIARNKERGIVNYTIRAMVVGIPNVGKSSFINRMAKNAIAKVGNRPGVTKNKQWIKTKEGIELLDTPGILWPKFEEETSLNLAFTGAIKDEIMDTETLALRLIERLSHHYKERLIERYALEEFSEDPLENMDNIARKRGCIIKGGEIDYMRVAVMILDEFRSAKLGKISLEWPEVSND